MGRPSAGWLLIALLALSAGVVGDGHLQAGPTLLELGPDGRATRLILSNTGTTTVGAQVRVYAWSQEQGADVLEPTTELAVSPPIAEVPAGGEQIVRIVRVGPPAAGRDRTYRIVVDELPRPAAEPSATIALRMRYVLPAFVRAPDASEPALTCALEAGTRLTCENRGGRPAQLGSSRLVGEDGRQVRLSDGLFGYVLPGSRRAWTLPADSPAPSGETLRLETQLNGRPVALDVSSAP